MSDTPLNTHPIRGRNGSLINVYPDRSVGVFDSSGILLRAYPPGSNLPPMVRGYLRRYDLEHAGNTPTESRNPENRRTIAQPEVTPEDRGTSLSNRGTQDRAAPAFQGVDEEGNITFFVDGRATSGVSNTDSPVPRSNFDTLVSSISGIPGVSGENPSQQGVRYQSHRDPNGNLIWTVSPPDEENTGQVGHGGIPNRQEIYGDIFRRSGENLEDALTQIITVAGREIAISIAIAPIGRLATLLMSLGGRGVRSFPQLLNFIRRRRIRDVEAALQTLDHSSLQTLESILTSARGNSLTANQISEGNRILGLLERELVTTARNLPSRYLRPFSTRQVNRAIQRLSQSARTKLQTILLNRDYRESIARIRDPRILRFINQFSQSRNFDQAVLNYVQGGNPQVGARFVMQWVVTHVPVNRAGRIIFEQSQRGSRFTDLIFNNVKYEFKNVMQLSNNQDMRRQLSHDINLVFNQQALGPNGRGIPNGLNWVFAGNRGLSIQTIRDTLIRIINTTHRGHPRRTDMIRWVQNHVTVWSP